MRRRWRISDGCLAALGGVWIFGWLPLFLGIWAICAPGGLNGDHGCPPAMIFLGVWFGVVIVPAVVVGAVMLVRFMWAERPRRVWESGEDLRKVHRDV